MSLPPAHRAPDPDPSAAARSTLGTGPAVPPPAIPSEGTSGDSIGPYKLLRVLGMGGMGQVWLAERREPMVQRVALKIIKAGMDTRGVIARFEQERQALAVMNHPNVAKVFDAGATPAGRPYFVMEHVPGEPITTYADRHNLSVRQRLELFIPVCEAIQHAHHKGIIHRDIKPSNILVAVRDGTPTPKIIDFGVAKAVSHTLTDQSVFTEAGQLIGTPEYMSPEQAEMGATDIDTRTDVYSLGVVLYELLAGLLPFDARALRAAGYDAIRKVLREQDAPKPSTRLSTADAATGEGIARHRVMAREQLARELRRELDWIPLKALRKDRTERYDTPADLAKDIGRYLAGEALEAGPESAAYRFKKFARRNKGPAFAVGAVMLALVVGLGLATWQYLRANERADAATKAEAATQLAKQDADEKRTVAEAKTAEAEAARAAADTARAAEVKAREEIENNSYVANVQMAQAAMENRQFDRLRQRLDACPERLRGWEWKWLNAEADSSLAELKGHTSSVVSAAFSPDGTRVVSASSDKTARVWDAATGASLTELKGHAGWVASAAFSSDGTRIVTASYDTTARVWDAASGTSLAELKGHTDSVASAAFNPDGTRIVTGSRDNTARVWDAATGTSLAELKGHTSAVRSAAFSPDGTRIVAASEDNTARVWDGAASTDVADLVGRASALSSPGFSPDGTRIVTANERNTARVWDVATGTIIAELKGHWFHIASASFSHDGRRIVTAAWDKSARVWDAATGASLAEVKEHTGVDITSPISTDERETVTVSAVFSRDGTRIVTALSDMTARVWDAATGTSIARLEGHADRVNSASFSPDGTRVVTASSDNTARVWNAATGTCLAELKRHKYYVTSASFSPDGTRIVTTSSDKTACIWDAATAACLAQLEGHTDQVRSAAFSPDGTRVITATGAVLRWGLDRSARVWDATTGACIAELKGHAASVLSAAFSPDGTRVVTAGHDQAARVWDAATGASLAELKVHTGLIDSATFSPDGTRIVTVSYDDTVGIWDSVPYRERFKELQARGMRK
ncbi:MAG: protein kinase domain-containing protein [Phycisphaerales bacterium]